MISHRLLPWLPLTLAAVGCDRAPTAEGSTPSASVVPQATTTAAAAASSQRGATTPAKRPDADEPRRKEHDNPTAETLGTLPEGVGLAVGTKVPDATVGSSEGGSVELAELADKGPLMIVFYRGGWCPFCNFQIRELTQAAGELKRRGVTPVAISVDQMSEAAKTEATYDIPFPVLSDPDLVGHEAFRVIQEVSDHPVGPRRPRLQTPPEHEAAARCHRRARGARRAVAVAGRGVLSTCLAKASSDLDSQPGARRRRLPGVKSAPWSMVPPSTAPS